MWDKTVDDKANRESIFLWLVLVVNFDRNDLPEFKKKVEDLVKCSLFEVKFRFYHLDDLKMRYDHRSAL